MIPIFLTVDEAKFDLKIDDDVEDADVESKINSAEAACQAYVRRPLTLEAFSWVLEAPKELGLRVIRVLACPIYPLASPGASAGNYSADGDVEILDGEGDLVSSADYRVERRTGLIYANAGEQFSLYPYTINAVAGCGARPDYLTFVVPLVKGAVLDTLRDFYLKRNPTAQTESTGGGVATNYFNDGLPKRVKESLDAIRMKRLV
jgi:hypothetical protein